MEASLSAPETNSLPSLVDSDIKRCLADGRAVILEVPTADRVVGYMVAGAANLDTATAASIIAHTDGFLCVAMGCDDLDRLHLPPMTSFSEAADGANYAVSVDAITGVTTGISAHDRASTVRALADSRTLPGDLTRPGHVLPVRVEAETPEQWGIAHAALGLTNLAGLRSATYAAILADDGEIADHRQLEALAAQLNLPLIDAQPLMLASGSVVADGQPTLDTPAGRFRAYEYWSPVDQSTRVALTRV